MESSKVIIRGGCVLSMDPAVGNRRDTDVLIEGGVVTEVGTNLRARGAEEIDATNSVVLPGFVDAHRHAGEALARHGSIGNGAGYTADDVYTATLAGLLGAAESGVTTVADWSAFPGDGHIGAVLQAHEDAGLRTVLVPAGGESGWWRRRLDAAATTPPNTTLAAGPPTPDDWAVARNHGLRIHVHADSAHRPSQLAQLGLLGSDVTLAHCSGLGAAEYDQVAATGAAVALTPAADMANGAPPTPVQEIIDRDIRPGLGTGALTTGSGDMLTQLRTIISLQHAMYFDLKLAGKAGLPRMLTTRDVIRYGTVDSARAIGMADTIGSIAPGRRADIVLLRTDKPNIAPVNDPIGAVVWGMDTSNVDTVLVEGRPLVRDGSLTADMARVRALITEARRRIDAHAGTTTGGPA